MLKDLRRLFSSTGLYAAAALAQRGVGFLLIPLYTRLIDPGEYGALELLTAFSSIAFSVLTLGLGSAINKCYHRDCPTPEDKASVLLTSIALDLPVLVVVGGTVLAFAGPISTALIGITGAQTMLTMVVLSTSFYAIGSLGLAMLRAQERPVAFSLLTLLQFVTAVTLNVLFVVVYRLGVFGILLGNLISTGVLLPAVLWVSLRGVPLRMNRNLVMPLLRFGLFLIPVMLASWVMDVSDRYVLRLYRGLDEVAVYGVGYKIGMAMDMAVVWPFQLAWPAFAFSISHQPDHRVTYARTMTYFSIVLTFFVLVLSLGAQPLLSVAVGAGYREAYRVVAVVTLAYALNGIQYCVSPGAHIAGKTRYLSAAATAAAVLNLGLTFLLVPRFGMMGAAWATVLAFGFVVAVTWVVSQRAHPVPYEYGRLARVLAAGLLVHTGAQLMMANCSLPVMVGCVLAAVLTFPLLLVVTGFVEDDEWAALRGILARRRTALFSSGDRY